MASLQEFRSQYPQYDDMPDAELADALHRKHYSDLPRDEFMRTLGVQDTQGAAFAGGPTDREGLVAWIARNPQAVADFIAQGIGATGGIVGGGAIGGPPGAIAGGAAGSVLGKKLSRWAGGAEQPDVLESGIDAVAGGAGPAVSGIMQAARPVAGKVFGGGREALANVVDAQAVKQAARGKLGEVTAAHEEQVARTAQAAERSQAGKSRTPFDLPANMAFEQQAAKRLEAAVDQAFDAAVNAGKAEKQALRKALASVPSLDQKTVNLVSAATAVLHNPVTAVGVFLGGIGVRTLHENTARAFLRSPGLIEWALTRGPGLTTPQQIAGSLTALAAEGGLSADEQATARAVAADIGLEPARETAKPLRESRGRPWRDEGGRFAVGPTIFDGGPKHGDLLL